MAKVDLEFEGEGSGLREELQAQLDILKQIEAARKEANQSTQAAAQQNIAATERVNKALETTVGAIAVLGKADTGKLAESLDDAADSAERLGEAGETGAESMKSAFEEIVTEAKKAAKEQGVVVKGLDEQKSKSIDLLRSIGALTGEEAKLAKEALAVVDAFEAQSTIADKPVEAFKSLRVQIREAKQELDVLIESSDGKITPELVAAAQRAGELDDRFKDLNDTVRAFNPDERLRPFVGIINNVASGFQAATAAAGLFGSESEDVGRALLKIQQTVAFVQGLQGFLSGFQDNLRIIRTQLLATAAAQRTATVATVADTGAKVAQTTATAAATTGTIGFTGAIKGLTAALLSNPFTAIAVALLAVGVAIVNVLDDTEELKAEVDGLIASLDELTQARFRQIALRGNLKLIQNEIDFIKAGGTERAKQAREEADYFARREQLIARQIELESNLRTQREQLLSLINRGADEEVIKTATEALDGALIAFREVNDEIKVMNQERVRDNAQTNADILKASRDLAKKRLSVEERLATDLLAVQRDLQKKLQQVALEEADPAERLRLEREASLGELRILEQTLKRKIALIELEKRIGVEAFEDLTEAQRNARADAMVNRGEISLAVEQTEQIANLEFAIWGEYYYKLKELDQKNQAERLKIQEDGAQKERALLETNLTEIAKAQRLAGATEAEILAFKQRERTKLERKLTQDQIDLEQRLGIALVEARERNGQNEIAFEEGKQAAILKIKIEAARLSLQNLEGDLTEEGAVRRKEFAALIAGYQAEIDALKKSDKIDLFALLGLELDEAEKQEILNGIREIANLASVVTAAAQAEVQANLNATQLIISDREKRVDELESQLERELDLGREGLANNSALISRRLQEEARAAAIDKQRERDLIEEQKRLAKQQLAIDSVIQGSALVTAAAVALAKAAKDGGVAGIVAAIASIAAMIAFFIGVQQQAKAITGGTTLGEGGVIKGPRHSKGGVPIPGTDVVAEGGEMVTNRKSTRKHMAALEAINQDDFSSPRVHKWLLDQLENTGISLDPNMVEQTVEGRREYNAIAINNQMDTKRLERRIDILTDEMSGLREDLTRREGTYSHKGKIVHQKGPNRTIRR